MYFVCVCKHDVVSYIQFETCKRSFRMWKAEKIIRCRNYTKYIIINLWNSAEYDTLHHVCMILSKVLYENCHHFRISSCIKYLIVALSVFGPRKLIWGHFAVANCGAICTSVFYFAEPAKLSSLCILWICCLSGVNVNHARMI